MHKVCHKYLDVKLQILIKKKKLDSKKYILLLKNLKIHISNYSHIEFPPNQ